MTIPDDAEAAAADRDRAAAEAAAEPRSSTWDGSSLAPLLNRIRPAP